MEAEPHEPGAGFTLDRALAAAAGKIDPAELTATERRYFWDYLDTFLAGEEASPEAIGRRDV